MCGIAGFEIDAGHARERASVLLSELARRGPDGGWQRLAGRWCLVQTRLAVIDLSDRVRYPMANESNDVLLLFNGEIYNHERLRGLLRRAGHRFATRCDAEVIVHGYEEWGLDVVTRLNGMFAIALLDLRTGDLVLARDPMGIKPLVRTTSGPFAFGSDAMALVAAGLAAPAVDTDALAEFAAFHYVPEPRTGIEHIEQVPPGSLVRRRHDGTETIVRWAPPLFDGAPPERRVTAEEADAVLRGAVERQLKADVDVGVFLSGGVDSALVLDYAVEVGARPVAFTISFAGFGDYDESQAALAASARLGVQHEVEVLSAGFAETIREIARAHDTPLADESAIATLPLARLARKRVTVALSGTGGDDLFAGYYRHRAPLVERVLRAVPPWLLARAAARGPDRGSERRSAAALAGSYLSRLAELARQGATGAEHYLLLVGSSTSPAGLGALRWAPDVAGARRAVAERLGFHAAALDDIQNFELRTYLPGCILMKEDRATMAHSLEGRVPMLDQEVAALAARCDARQRAGLGGGKKILREVARRRLPGRTGRKRGFAVPLRGLFDGPWRDEATEWLRARDSELVDGVAAARLVGRSDVPPLDLWAICVLCAWEERLTLARRRAASVGDDIEGPLTGADAA